MAVEGKESQGLRDYESHSFMLHFLEPRSPTLGKKNSSSGPNVSDLLLTHPLEGMCKTYIKGSE